MATNFTEYYSYRARTQIGAYNNGTGIKTATTMFLEGEALSGKYKHIVIDGKTRSGKTFGVIQLLKEIAEREETRITIVRQSMCVLNATVKKDCEAIMRTGKFNYTNVNIPYGMSTISFADRETSLQVSDITFINQAEEITYEFAKDIIRKTRGFMIYDLSEIKGTWIEKDILSRPDCAFLQTNYKDNPFIPQVVLDEFEFLKAQDPDRYKQFVCAD